MPGKNYKDKNIAGTNNFVRDSNVKFMNLLLYHTEHSQNTMFDVVILRISFYISLKLIFEITNVAVTTLLSRGNHF